MGSPWSTEPSWQVKSTYQSNTHRTEDITHNLKKIPERSRSPTLHENFLVHCSNFQTHFRACTVAKRGVWPMSPTHCILYCDLSTMPLTCLLFLHPRQLTLSLQTRVRLNQTPPDLPAVPQYVTPCTGSILVSCPALCPLHNVIAVCSDFLQVVLPDILCIWAAWQVTHETHCRAQARQLYIIQVVPA